jgi:tetratricopeptide (TPR) repeat protein
VRTSSAWASAILAATALAFLAMPHLPSFDTPKLAVLVLGATVLAFLVARRRPGTESDGVLADPILALPLLLAVTAGIAGIIAWPRGSLVGPVTAIACIALARLAAQTDDVRRAVRVAARGAAIAAAVAGAYGLAQKAGLDFTPWAEKREPVSTFGNTSFAAEFQAAALPLSVLLALHRDSRRGDRILGGVAAALGIAHLVVANSRTDFLAAAAGVGAAACLLLHARGRSRAAAALALGGAAAGVALALAFFAATRGDGPSILGRTDTVVVRSEVWKSTSRMIADAPFGFRGTSFVDAYPAYRSPEEFRISGNLRDPSRRVETPHDDFLEIAVAVGIPGLVAALGVVALLARRLAATARLHAAETAALGATLAAAAVSALASSPLSHPATALLPALAAGLVVAAAPRPLRGLALPARAADVVFVVLLALAVWPGPVWRGLRSDGFLALGRSHRESGRTELAFELLDESAAVDPQAFDARFELGSLLHSAGRRDEAITALESAAALRPDDYPCRAELAYAYRDAGRAEDAKKIVEDGLARCPWHPLLLGARAIFALSENRVDAAVDAADRAAAVLPKHARIRALAAEAHLAASPGEASYTACLDSLAQLFAEGNTDDLGRCARSMVRRDASLLGPLATRARRIVKEEPDLAAALVLAAAPAAKDAGFLDDASRILHDAKRPDESTILLGRSLGVRAAEAYAAGMDSKALKLAQQASDRDPSAVHFLLTARAAARLGERDGAIEAIGAAVAAGPVDAGEVRSDPVLSQLLPDRRLEEVLARAERRSGETRTAPHPR